MSPPSGVPGAAAALGWRPQPGVARLRSRDGVLTRDDMPPTVRHADTVGHDDPKQSAPCVGGSARRGSDATRDSLKSRRRQRPFRARACVRPPFVFSSIARPVSRSRSRRQSETRANAGAISSVSSPEARDANARRRSLSVHSDRGVPNALTPPRVRHVHQAVAGLDDRRIRVFARPLFDRERRRPLDAVLRRRERDHVAVLG